MMPKFLINEDVLLKSRNNKHLDGEYKIIDIVEGVGCGDNCVCDTSYSIGAISAKGHDFWCECALRKIFRPSSYSFSELMESLTNTDKAK